MQSGATATWTTVLVTCWSVAKAIPVFAPASGSTIELEATIVGVGADYFEQDLHQFRCYITPTNQTLDAFYAGCTRQQAWDYRGDSPKILMFAMNEAAPIANASLMLARAAVGIEEPAMVLTKFQETPDRTRVRRVVPDGDRTQLVVRIEYNDAGVSYCSESCARAMINSPNGGQDVDTLFHATSYGRIRFPASRTRVITVRVNSNVASKTGCPFLAMSNEADTLATQQHTGLNLDDFTHKTYLIPSNTPGCGWGGVAYVNTCANGPHPYCKAWIRVNSGGVLAHELGHNLGTIHAADDPEDDGTQNLEYGDYGCVMGGAGWVTMNAPHRELMDWIGSNNGVSTCSVGGSSTVSIARLDLSPGSIGLPTMIKIPRYGGGNYLLSFKSPSDWDATSVRASYRNSIQVHNHDGSLTNTKYIRSVQSGQSFSGQVGSGSSMTFTVSSVSADSATLQITGATCLTAGTRNPTRSGSTNRPTAPPTAPPNGNGNPDKGSISCGQTVSGSTISAQNVLGNAAGDNYYSFTVTQAQSIQFDACDSGYDTWIRIYDNALTQEIIGCDDCGSCPERTRTRLGHVLSPGTYKVVIEGWDAAEGLYTMEMSCNSVDQPTNPPSSRAPSRPPSRPPTRRPTRPPTSPPANFPTTMSPTTDGTHQGSLVCGQQVTGSTVNAPNILGNLAGDHTYTLTLQNEQMLEIDACDSEFDTWIRIYSDNLNQELIGCDDCGGCSVSSRTRLATTLSAGTYIVVIDGFGDEEGTYTLSLSCPQSCTDSHYLCGLWSRIGYCLDDHHDGYMRTYCPSSCAMCPGFEHAPPPRDTSPDSTTIVTTTSRTTLPPSTMYPTPSPPVSCHIVECGRGVDRCNELQSHCAADTALHAVRCCSDTSRSWIRRTGTDPICPWTESDNYPPLLQNCVRSATFSEAKSICESGGARLCTVEESQPGCLRGTGCGHDNRLIWTSNSGAFNPKSLAHSIIALATNESDLTTSTSTAEPQDSTERYASDPIVTLQEQSEISQSDDDGNNDGLAIGLTVGLIVVTILVVLVVSYWRRHRRNEKNQAHKTVAGHGQSLEVRMRHHAKNLAADAALTSESETDKSNWSTSAISSTTVTNNRNSMC